MQTTVIFIDNYDSFTYNLVEEFRVLGAEVLVYRNDTDTALIKQLARSHRARGAKVVLLLSPGPSTPDDAHNLLPIITDNLGEFPMLGVCLGHQALGQALGGTVRAAPEIVHGKSSLITHTGEACFKGLPSPLRVARYHSLIVASLPSNVRILAEHEGVCMALYESRLKVIGLQFHPESIMTAYGRRLLSQALEIL